MKSNQNICTVKTNIERFKSKQNILGIQAFSNELFHNAIAISSMGCVRFHCLFSSLLSHHDIIALVLSLKHNEMTRSSFNIFSCILFVFRLDVGLVHNKNINGIPERVRFYSLQSSEMDGNFLYNGNERE